MRTRRHPGITRRGGRSLPAAVALALALTLGAACDRGTPAEIDRPKLALAAQDGAEAYFTSTPPDPAYVGGTYEVSAESVYDWAPEVLLESDTPAVCSFDEQAVVAPATLSLVAAGTCRLSATCRFCIYLISSTQEFEVVAPWTPGTPGAPVTPGVPPGRGGPFGPGGPPR
jgi:hypothetical protein